MEHLDIIMVCGSVFLAGAGMSAWLRKGQDRIIAIHQKDAKKLRKKLKKYVSKTECAILRSQCQCPAGIPPATSNSKNKN